MQAKVSMVMPCYNKEEQLGNMLRSVMGQTWDNIEVILVNDGSTDGTRAVIGEWAPRLRQRGYEVVVVDQQNAGVCAAARAGLSRVTGEYVCQVDADDELSPVYVSTMAAWLEAHPDYDYCVCDFVTYVPFAEKRLVDPFFAKADEREAGETGVFPHVTEKFILNQLFGTVWLYLVRTSYFHKCGVLENYATASRGSHEPGFILPVNACGGKMKYFALPLYRFNVGGQGMSHGDGRFASFEKYYTEHTRLAKEAIQALPGVAADEKRKEKLLKMADFAFLRLLCLNYEHFDGGAEHRERLLGELAAFTGLARPAGEAGWDELARRKHYLLSAAVNGLLETPAPKPPDAPGRVIAYGAKGKNGARLVPLLCETNWKPDVLWDAAVSEGETELYGLPLEKPDFTGLCASDALLLLPTKREAVVGIFELLNGTGIGRVLDAADIADCLAHGLFPAAWS